MQLSTILQKHVEATTKVKKHLSGSDTPIGANDTAIVGHAIAVGCVLVTNNTKEFERVNGLYIEDWTE